MYDSIFDFEYYKDNTFMVYNIWIALLLATFRWRFNQHFQAYETFS